MKRASRLPLNAPTLLGGLILLLGLLSIVTAPSGPVLEPPQHVSIEPVEEPAAAPYEVSIVLVDAGGVERPVFRTLELPEALTARLEIILQEVRRLLMEDDVWPEALAAPQVFVTERAGGQQVAVLDFLLPEPVPVSVAQEAQIFASLESTLRRHSYSRMVILVNGRPAETFLGHLALRSTLE